MAAMAPPRGYYDTGVIDSEAVQDQFPNPNPNLRARITK